MAEVILSNRMQALTDMVTAGSPGSKAGESRDYFVGAGWCAFAGAAGIGSADGLR